MNHSILGVPLFGPLYIGMAAANSGAGLGATATPATESVAGVAPESEASSSLAPVEGFTVFCAGNKNVGIKNTANVAMAIVLMLSFNVVSYTARRDNQKFIAAV